MQQEPYVYCPRGELMKFTNLALGQFEPRVCDKDYNIRKMEEQTAQAAKNECDLIIFPEMSLTGYVCRDLIHKLSEPIRGPSIGKLERVAREHNLHLVLGMPEESEARGIIHNSSVLLGPAGVVGAYRKMYLPTHSVFEEKRYFRPGYEIRTFSTTIGNIGMLICYDLFFPEIARLLAVAGAQIIVCISASPSGRRDYFETLTKARAIENSVFLAYVNLVGIEDGLQFWGGSHVLSPEGKLLAKAKYDEEDLVFATIDYEDLPRARTFLPTLKDLRPELFESLQEKARAL